VIGERPRSDTDTDAIETQAAAWFARQRRGGMSTVDEAAFAAWLSADAQHVVAYDAVLDGWRQVEQVRADPSIIALREAALRRRRIPRAAIGWSAGALAASVALLLVLAPGLVPESRVYERAVSLIPAAQPLDDLRGELHATTLGETRAVSLPDGSVVTLDTDSSVRVAYADGTRLVMLEHGQAFFEVAKDRRRPFIVFAGNKRVLAVGTAFDVRVDGDEVSVTLREGKVRVEAPAHDGDARTNVQAAELVPGTRLTASSRNGWHLAKADLGRNLSWLHGQLVFDGEALGSAIAEMNRYSATKIVLRDAELARLPISGVFAAGQPEVLADALAAYKLVRIVDRNRTVITLAAPAGK
jgi:transmembrane sensor